MHREASMNNKVLVALIAGGLWANFVLNVIRPAKADSDFILNNINSRLGDIRDDINSISVGTCTNPKLC
jgi:hypothetical protein